MITLDPVEHRYSDETGRQYTSVSRIIEACYPEKTWADAPIARIEHARERGIAVEAYFNQYLLTGTVDVPAGENEDRLDYLERLIKWWESNQFAGIPSGHFGVQEIVSDKLNLIAGSIDLLLKRVGVREKRTVIDIKCVAELQKSYELQLGAYADFSAADECGCLWVSKKAVKWVPFDAARAIERWRCAKSWYLTKTAMEAK